MFLVEVFVVHFVGAANGPQVPVIAVAENFDVSRPAISKHIKILTECGLITIKQQGRERYCEARLQKLNEVSDWIEQYRVFWNKKLDALDDYLASETPKKSKRTSSKIIKSKRK